MYVGLKRAKQGIEYLVWEDKMIIFFRDTLPKTLAKNSQLLWASSFFYCSLSQEKGMQLKGRRYIWHKTCPLITPCTS
jgi:sorbitol-specific phosphotransferase system component IIA